MYHNFHSRIRNWLQHGDSFTTSDNSTKYNFISFKFIKNFLEQISCEGLSPVYIDCFESIRWILLCIILNLCFFSQYLDKIYFFQIICQINYRFYIIQYGFIYRTPEILSYNIILSHTKVTPSWRILTSNNISTLQPSEVIVETTTWNDLR